jgi:hypothetical protein
VEEERRPKPGNREITYRVGWKKGKLEVADGKVKSAESYVFLEKALWLRLLDRFVWRPLPLLPERALLPVLWALPLVAFGTTWWLVYMLSRP